MPPSGMCVGLLTRNFAVAIILSRLSPRVPALEAGLMTLAAWLAKRKLTQAEFAILCGLSETHVCRLVSGVKYPSFETMVRIHNETVGKGTFRDMAGPRLVTCKQAC